MPETRPAARGDLASLMDLYHMAEVSSTAQPEERVQQIWDKLLVNDGVTVFVSVMAQKVIASCVLINLLRGGQQHGFLENVVTHPDFRGQGYGGSVVKAALAAAWAEDCYHVLLQSGRKDPQVHRFYERQGFEPGIRTGYVMRRPTEN